jgi:hypothetical protein
MACAPNFAVAGMYNETRANLGAGLSCWASWRIGMDQTLVVELLADKRDWLLRFVGGFEVMVVHADAQTRFLCPRGRRRRIGLLLPPALPHAEFCRKVRVRLLR